MSRSRKALVTLAILALVALPVSNVLANHYFEDVPTSAFYHNSVTALANAGITGGCNAAATKYCPNSAVTRGQMAVFLDRVANLRNEHGAVVDALLLNGEIFAFGVETYTLTGGAGVVRECQTAPEGTGLPYGFYAINYTMVAVPATMTSDEVIVSIVDDGTDDPLGNYQVCFRRVTAGDLLAGDYTIYGLAGGFIGQGIFAGAHPSNVKNSIARFLPSWNKR